jgi:hypothetical protein
MIILRWILGKWIVRMPGKGKGKGKAIPVLFLTEHHTMKTYWGNGVDGGEWSASCPGLFTPREEPLVHIA